MAEAGEDSHKVDGEEQKECQLVQDGGDCVPDLGLVEKQTGPSAQDGVVEEAPSVNAAKEIMDEILNEVRTPPNGGEEEEGSKGEADENKGAGDVEGKDIELVKDATKLLEKLEIADGSEGGGSASAEDDQSSSLDSTANSGARPAEGEDTPSDEKESLDGATERPKKRIDLQHQFLRGIVKIQLDRDEYEKQCQTKKQERLKDRDPPVGQDSSTRANSRADSRSSDSRSSRAESRNSGTSSRTQKRFEAGKRQHSSMESGRGGGGFLLRKDQLNFEDSHNQQQVSKNRQEIYRPPSIRNTPSKDDRPRSFISGATEDVGIRITFDTEKQRRSIQLSKPSVGPGEGDGNLVVSFDTTRKERHIETTGGSGRVQPQLWSERPNNYKYKDGGGEPQSGFLFKATDQNVSSPGAARAVRASGRFRGSKPFTDIGSTPRPLGEKQGFLILNTGKDKTEDTPTSTPTPTPIPGKEKGSISPAPPAKEKGGGISATPEVPPKSKWSDIVESESEPSPTFNIGSPSNSSTPDVLESNQWRSSTGNRRRGGPRNPRQQRNPSRQHQQQQQQQPEADNSPSPQPSESQNSGGRKSVWERLGPRPWLDRPSTFGTVQYEPGSMASMREMAERDYLSREDSNCENSESAVQAAYRDTKQKRTRMELYVPRRGGT